MHAEGAVMHTCVVGFVAARELLLLPDAAAPAGACLLKVTPFVSGRLCGLT
jgi:hypothetical protein